MAENKFKVFSGEFHCKQCKEEVSSLRLWVETGDATWMCSKKHITKVELMPQKKKKSDFDDE